MSETTIRRGFKKKRYTVPIIILILLIAFRLYLPTLVKNNINKVLADIPGYYGQVEDVDIALIRGAYVINGMYLSKGTAESQVPFLNFPKSDISIEWKSLFKGKIVSEIIMTSPEVIYVFEDQKEESGDADVDDWTKALTDIVPIDINHFEVHDGKVAFVQLSAEPNIDLQIDKLELTADNLRNVVEKERILPSPIRASGVSIGKGKVSLEGNMNLVKEIPDMDLSFSLENAEATALNDFTNYYAGIDFDKGTFGVYSEVAIADGHLIGYVKPLLTDTKLIGEGDGFLEILWEGFVGFFKFILKNQGTDTLATKVPFEGDLNNVEAGVWPTVFNIFKNAWIKAFTGEVDDDINFKDAFKDGEITREQKRELRKKEREEKREQRKKEREAKKG
ncbi:hypothetical protein A7A78_12835 [Aequorivita soesokkakensis]|uniref:DUF748 domain-containing protein n=1 Tax=Aequorivita soesokkakensis TaxID=1385699 RepID=A0A1A9LEZ0_9FLAO|nr:DUF748 domain-containing protein [Aequorivita soesokkakensis]OAD91262.1 hypothetical protein A7A78_12835 [Aequorivita soesokkakensis]